MKHFSRGEGYRDYGREDEEWEGHSRLPDHGEFMRNIDAKKKARKKRPIRYLWQIVLLRRALLCGILLALVLFTFSPLKFILSREHYSVKLNRLVERKKFDDVLSMLEKLAKEKTIDGPALRKYRLAATDGKFVFLYDQAMAAVERHDLPNALENLTAFIDYVADHREALRISGKAFALFEREIHDDIGTLKDTVLKQQSVDSLKAEYMGILEELSGKRNVIIKLDMLLDAILHRAKIESLNHL
ncbi:MAG: hypothetical protein MJA29_02245 [Candidatus Omnitrophica bacterium]|nr:hypothetical protein [Candidatus Omnitrophota bacterium]